MNVSATASQVDEERGTKSEGLSAIDRYRRDVNFIRLLKVPIPATHVLVAALGVIFILGHVVYLGLVQNRLGTLEQGLYPSLLFGAKINPEIDGGAWWRLITSTFLHGSGLHLAFNAFALWRLGAITERLFGTRRFLLIYGLSGVAGALASYMYNDMASVGASGAIFGVFGATVVFGYRQRAVLPPRVAKMLSTQLLPWLVLSLALGLIPVIRIDNAAHLGGLITGSVLAMVLETPLTGRRHPVSWALMGGVVVVLGLATLISLSMMVHFASTCLADADTWTACQALWPPP